MKAGNEALSRLEVVSHDPGWAAAYQAEAELLRSRLPSFFAEMEHIGSTAIPHLQAKPIIDLMASTGRLQNVRRFAGEAPRHVLQWYDGSGYE